MNFKKEIIRQLEKHGASNVRLEVPPPGLGDFAFPCFVLSKHFKRNPTEIATDLAKKIKLSFLEKIDTKGPYLNFFIKKTALIEYALATPIKKFKKTKRQIMIEYCAPNTNKPLHLGHLRNIFLGYSVSLLLQYVGYKVIQTNLINDRGIHISQSMLAYQKWGKNKKPNKKSDHFVGDYYVMFQQHKNEELSKEAYALLQKYEQGDKKTLALWKKMNRWALDGFNQTFNDLGITFNKVYYESKYFRKAKDLVLEYYKKDVFKMDKAGNMIAEFDQMPYRVVLRDDGTSVYVTQDIYLAYQKFKDYKLEKSLYVVATEQNLHFQQLFEILKQMGMKKEKLHHLSYGLVHLPSGRMKSREGQVIDADDIISEISLLAAYEIEKRHKLPKKERTKRSKAIGLAALKYYMLKFDPIRDITYNPKESIAFEGETGPYIQYTHARIASIFRKYKKRVGKVKVDVLKNKDDADLATILNAFQATILKAAQDYKPSLLCNYLTQLCQAFNNYYAHFPILKADEDLRKARLYLAKKVQETIAVGLKLLGIEALDKM